MGESHKWQMKATLAMPKIEMKQCSLLAAILEDRPNDLTRDLNVVAHSHEDTMHFVSLPCKEFVQRNAQ